MKLLPIVCLIALLSGCQSSPGLVLPEVTAKHFKAVHNNPYVSVEIEATNVVNLPDRVTADKAVYRRNGRLSSGNIEVEGYERLKK